MRRLLISMMVLCIAGLRAGAQEVPSVAPKTHAQTLYEQALAEQADGNPKQAIQTAAQVVALNYDAGEWLPKAELLCALLYIELGMLEQADVTARQVESLYDGTAMGEQAQIVCAAIEKLKKEVKLKEGDK